MVPTCIAYVYPNFCRSYLYISQTAQCTACPAVGHQNHSKPRVRIWIMVPVKIKIQTFFRTWPCPFTHMFVTMSTRIHECLWPYRLAHVALWPCQFTHIVVTPPCIYMSRPIHGNFDVYKLLQKLKPKIDRVITVPHPIKFHTCKA